MTVPPLRTILAALAAAPLGACARTAPATTATPAHWSITGPAVAVKPGAVTNVRVSATIDDGWHIYSLTQGGGGPTPTRITLPADQPFVAAGPPAPTVRPHVAFDSAFGMKVEMHETAVGFNVPVRFVGGPANVADSVHVNVRYQVCNSSLCFPPQTAKLAAVAPHRVQ